MSANQARVRVTTMARMLGVSRAERVLRVVSTVAVGSCTCRCGADGSRKVPDLGTRTTSSAGLAGVILAF